MTNWTPVSERLPELGVPVWLFENGIIWIGCRADDADGWLWANCYGSQAYCQEKLWYCEEAETDDDYKPTHWKSLPEPPK